MKLKTKENLQISALIVFEAMWVVCTWLLGQWEVSLMKKSGAIILIRDIIGAYVGTFIAGGLIVAISWAYICDYLDK